jgi:hypothetical protein
MPRFSVVTGEFEVEQVIDINGVGVDVKIDFSGQGNKVYASVTQGNEGTFDAVTYSASPPDVRKPK